ncbi:MAG: extracellular solute-binding protein [Burkholderiaceae bacterium]|nr:extracellular solute-binding protein [Burkholderiaceae bacterium]
MELALFATQQILETSMTKIRTRLASLAPIAAVIAVMFSGAVHAQSAEVMSRLAKGAVANGNQITWYESSPEDQIGKVLAGFSKEYPEVKVRYVRLVGGNELASRVIQEEQAAGKSADVLTGGADHLWQLNSRGLLKDLSAENLDLSEQLLPASYAVPTTASVFVQIWNTKKIKDADVPKSWDELLDPKWTGKIGNWVRAAVFSQLSSVWGEEKAETELRKLVALKPYLFKSTFPLAQGVASGEVDVAIGFYHSLQPVLKAGAPINFSLLNPTPMYTISSGIPKSTVNPDAAMLLAMWLMTPNGAKIYEDATSRGNHLVASTDMHKMLQGVQLAEWSFDDTEKLAVINDKFNAILADGPKAR